jgi:hypothetical protein
MLGRDAIKRALARPNVRAALGNFVKNTLVAGAAEVSTEVAQEAITIFAGEAAKTYAGDDFPMASPEDVAERLGDTFTQTLQTMTIMGPALASSRHGQDAWRANRARYNLVTLDRLHEHAQADELAKRLPDKATDAVRTLAENAAIKNVFISPEAFSTYFQTAQEATQFAAKAGITEEYNEAMRLGRDIQVPIESYYVNIAATELGEAFKPYVKFAPEEMSATEADAFNEAWTAAQEKLREEHDAATAVDQQALEGEERVFQDVKTKAMDAGIIPDQAEQYGKLYSAFFRAMAQRTGTDAGELYQRYGFDIKRALPTEREAKAVDNLDLALELVRRGRVAPLRKKVEQASGPSLLAAIIARGGIEDAGGELAAMDVPARLIRPAADREPGMFDAEAAKGEAFNEFSADDVMRQMWKDGYFPEFDERPTTDALFDAIREELSGRKRFSTQQDKTGEPDVAAAAGMVQFADMLDQLGIDPETMDNDAIRAAIEEATNADPETAALFQVPPDVARTLRTPVNLPTDQTFIDAVANTEGAEITEDGLLIDLARWQPDEQSGAQAVRTGVFYLPAKSTNLKHYKGGKHGYGGNVKVQGETLIRNPLFVKGATGGKAPEAAYDALKGKGSFEKMEKAVNSVVYSQHGAFKGNPGIFEEAVAKLLDEWGGNSNVTWELIRVSSKGNTLRYALKEHIIAHAIREAGHDAMVGWSKGKSGPFISEVFDVREDMVPTPEGDFSIHEEYYQSDIGAMEAENVVTEYARGNLTAAEARKEIQALGWDVGPDGFRKKYDSVELIGPDGQTFRTYGQNKDGKRGSIQLAPGRTIINMFDQADLSTFLHESGHFFLEVFRDMAATAPAVEVGPQRSIVSDWQATKEYLGIGDDGVISTEAHEKFARTFEAYLFEGKSPSNEVASIMSRFRSWLTFVYHSISKLGVPINDNMRRVMDRLIATDEEIAAASRTPEFRPAFASAEEAGMTDLQYAEYLDTAARAVERAKREMDARMMQDIARETTREWRDQRQAIRKEVEAEYEKLPVYRAIRYLRTGKGEGVPEGRMYMDREAIVQMKGEGALYKLPALYRVEGGVHPDFIAELFGFKSGDEMLTRMMSAPPMAKAIVEETALRMRTRYGDLMGDAVARARVAAEAIATDETGELLNAEIGALVKKGLATTGVSATQARRLARELVRAKPIRDALRVKLYLNADRKAASEAEAAIRAGDFVTALAAKKRQLLNHYMAMEAINAEKEVTAAVTYLNRFAGRKRPKGVDPDYLDRIEQTLERFDLRRSVSLKEEQRRTSLAAWINEREANGDIVVVPDVLRNDAFRKPYKQMTPDDLMAVRDAVKNFEHLGRLKGKLLANQKQREFAGVRDEMVAAISASQDLRPADKTRNPTRWSELRQFGASLESSLLKMEQVFDWMDGGDINGPLNTYVWRPIADAETRENDMRVKVVGEFQRIMSELDSGRLNERVTIAGVRQTFLRSDIMAVALNTGNESNLDKMKRGEAWTDQTVQTIVSHLDEKEWQAVQGIWDLINSFWPEIAAVQRRLTGVEPPKVEAREVETPYGKLRGGYYPMIYDPRRSHDVEDRNAAAVDRMFENTYLRPETRHGFTKERAQAYTRPLLFDLDGAARHLTAVIHDMTHREAILDAYKLLSNATVRTEIEQRYGPAIYQQIVPWLQSVAHDAYKNDGLRAAEKLFQSIRSRATIVGLGFRVSTILAQLAGFSSSLEMIPVKHMLGAIKDFSVAPQQMWETVKTKSGELRHRSTTVDRDIRDQLRTLTGKTGKLDAAKRFAYYGIGFMDKVVSVPSWMAAYRDHLARNPDDEAGAIAHADKVIRLVQGAGGAKDLAAVQRSNELTKLVTMFYSYFSAYYNRQRAWGRDAGRAIARREYSELPHLLARQVFMTIGPAVLGQLLVGEGPDDDESYAEWAARKIAFYPVSAVPVVRDAFGVFDKGFSYSFTPAARAVDEVLVQPFLMLAKAVEGEADARKMTKQALDTVGYLFKLPTGQLSSTVDNVWRGIEEDDFQWRDLVLPRDKSRN